MRYVRRITGSLVALLIATTIAAAPAFGANESVELSLEAEPAGGPLFKELEKPVKASLRIQVSVPQGQPRITPMINSRVKFPPEMTFSPDPRVTPPCPASKVGPQSSLASGVAAMVSNCPDSVIGTGRATIKLAQLVAGELDDPQLVVFNAGETSAGRPRITIYGYSQDANAGLVMTGFLARNGELDIAIGTLPFDSSVSDFTLGIPGEPIEVPPGTGPGGADEVVGKDPGYLVARCSDGEWEARGAFSFASRNPSTGALTSSVLDLESNPVSLPCEGRTGRPVISPMKVRLAGSNGLSRTLRVSVSNRGTATARGLRLKVTGSGKGETRIDPIAPGRSTKVLVKVRLVKTQKASHRLRLKLTGKGVSAVKKIRLRNKG